MTAEELIDLYLQEVQTTEVIKPLKPCKKSLAQKQGARKGGRTRSRKQYVEKNGFLYYNYYARPKKDKDLDKE